MINTLTAKSGTLHHASVLVAYEKNTGRILGTFTSAVDGQQPDPTSTAHVRDRFIADLKKSLGEVLIETVQVSSKDFDARQHSRVDPLTRTLARSAPDASAPQRKHQVLLDP